MPRPLPLSILAAPLVASAAGAALLRWLPGLDHSLFAHGAARLASLLQPGSVWLVPEGWQIGPADAARPVVVTVACSATDYFLLIAALLAWRLAPRPGDGFSFPRTAGVAALALSLALPLTLMINALRIVAVVAAHAWLIPDLPAAYADFAHQLVGVAVFLPALLAIDLVLTVHAHHLRLRPSLAHA